MSQQSSNQGERLAEYNKILLEVRTFFKDVLVKEVTSESAKNQCQAFIQKLDDFIKPPVIPPRKSGRISTTNAVDATQLETAADALKRKISDQGGKDKDHLASQEFLEEQRNLSRKGTFWSSEKSPHETKRSEVPVSSPSTESKTPERKESTLHEDDDAIYERIGHFGAAISKTKVNTSADTQQYTGDPPPVPERKGRSTTWYDKTLPLNSNYQAREHVMVHDLKNPLYSGLLRNVKSNTKQWCVVKRQKLYLFNDLQEPATCIADLREYSVFKDARETRSFHVRCEGKSSIILAAVDEEQYVLWYNAFRRAKILADTKDGKVNGEGELAEYLSLKGSEEIEDDVEDEDPSYEKPDVLNETNGERTISPTIYVSMDNPISPGNLSLSPHNYEAMDYPIAFFKDNVDQGTTVTDYSSSYSSMPLPPTPGDIPPELPERMHKKTASSNDVTNNKSDDESSSMSEGSLSGSFASLIESDQVQANTWPRKQIKGRKEKEVEFLRDLSAVYCGILHQRRMLAVWQKRFCKVKDQSLYCYRHPDSPEPSLQLQLPDCQLDRAEETWRSFSFKIYKDQSDVQYFAAESRKDLTKWLSVLAKEINKKRFLPNDITAMAPNYIREEETTSTEDSGNSSENISTSDHANSQNMFRRSSMSDVDGDTDSELSVESEDPFKKPRKLPKRKLLRGSNKASLSRTRSQSFEDPDAEIQGYLYRKLKNHWSRRWCCIKNEKLLSFKQSPRDPPDISILLSYASLTLPTEENCDSGYNVFKLRFEGGDNSAMFSTKQKETLELWVNIIVKYVGSKSEESFPYVNVPPSSNHTKVRSNTADSETKLSLPVPDYESSPKQNSVNRRLTSNFQLPSLPPRAPTASSPCFELSPRSSHEIAEARHRGFLTELQIFNQSFRHLERFVILTKEKQLKFYDDITSITPVALFYGPNIQIIDEKGADECIIRLYVEDTDKEILLKATDVKVCAGWKRALERIHYEEIDAESQEGDYDNDDEDELTNRVLSGDEMSTEKMFRKRSKSIDRKEKAEPVLLSHSKTMPSVGKMKKRAKEIKEEKAREKERSKTLTNQTPDTSSREKKGISSLIRSFTVDTLTRKAKNKSYEVPAMREDDILLKETQNGILKQVLENEGKEVAEDRFCRISGKVFYCYQNDKDKKPLVKVPLRNAAIEEKADVEQQIFRFVLTAMDSGQEYTFSVNSEADLDNWVDALYGDDKLHKTLDWSPSPKVPRNIPTKQLTPSVSSSLESGHSLVSPFLSSVTVGTGSNIDTPDSTKNSDDYFFNDNSLNDTEVEKVDEISRKTKRSSTTGSTSSISSAVFAVNQSINEENTRLSQWLFEITREGELSKTTSRRWVVLKKNVVELYATKRDKEPMKVLAMDDVTLLDSEEFSSKRTIPLQTSSGETTQLITPSDKAYKTWMNELKTIQKDMKRYSREKVKLSGRLSWKKGSVTELKNSKDKRASMMLVDDDVKVLEKYEETADPSKTLSGQLSEYFIDQKEKERYCWIRNGYFFISKRSKPDKVIKTIDLSTVVLLDESDPANDKYAFKLDYSQNDKSRVVYLQANDQHIADRWMVAISMGILFHRLSNSQHPRESRTGYESESKDFEFVTINNGDLKSFEPSVKLTDNKLGIDIKREIARKTENGEEELLPVSQLLKTEFPTPDGSPIESKKFKLPRLSLKTPSLDAMDGDANCYRDQKQFVKDQHRFSRLPDDEDNVFSSSEQALDLLENIPERENADETFKNVRGILRQQESIRRAILHRQSTKRRNQRHNHSDNPEVSTSEQKVRADSTSKKVPPKVKPKPKRRQSSTFKSYIIFDNFIPLRESLENLNHIDLQSYKSDLQGEKVSLLKCIKDINTVLLEAEDSLRIEGSVSEAEYQTIVDDLESMENRLQVIDKVLKNVHRSENRQVAAKMRRNMNNRKVNTIWYDNTDTQSQPNSPSALKRIINKHDEGYKSEPLLDNNSSPPLDIRKREKSSSTEYTSVII